MKEYIRLSTDVTIKMAHDELPPSSIILYMVLVKWATGLEKKFKRPTLDITPFIKNSEITELLGITASHASNLLHSLEEKGYVKLLYLPELSRDNPSRRRILITDALTLAEHELIHTQELIGLIQGDFDKYTYVGPVDKRAELYYNMNITSGTFEEYSKTLDKIPYVTKQFMYCFTKAYHEKFGNELQVWNGRSYGKMKPIFQKMNIAPLNRNEIEEFVNNMTSHLNWIEQLTTYFSEEWS